MAKLDDPMIISRHQIIAAILVLVIATLAALSTDARAQDPVQVVLLAGQSNMDGNVPIAALPTEFNRPPEKVSMIDRGQTARIAGGKFFGPEVAFAATVAAARPTEEFLLVKRAMGGTSLAGWAPQWDKSRLASKYDAAGQITLGRRFAEAWLKTVLQVSAPRNFRSQASSFPSLAIPHFSFPPAERRKENQNHGSRPGKATISGRDFSSARNSFLSSSTTQSDKKTEIPSRCSFPLTRKSRRANPPSSSSARWTRLLPSPENCHSIP